MEQGKYVICEATFGDKSDVVMQPEGGDDYETGVTIYAHKFIVQSDVDFFWNGIDEGADLSTSRCDDVRVGVFESGSNATMKYGPKSRVSGKFFAPKLKVQPGSASKIHGQVIARVFEGHPGEFYCCRCGEPGDSCETNGDCCDGGTCAGGSCQQP